MSGSSPEVSDAERSKRPRRDDKESDAESDTSEVLSVGSEPAPTLVDFREAATDNASRSVDENTRISSTPSPSSSTSAGYYQQGPGRAQTSSPPGYSQPPSSPTASSVRSPASSVTASSPGRPEVTQESILSRTHFLSRYHRDSDLDFGTRAQPELGHEIIYPTVERLQRTPISIPIVTRLSISPPSAMTVAGLQATTPLLHPTCRDPREASLLAHPAHLHQLHQTANIQHVPASSVHHHRLSVNKILQREPPDRSSPGPREDERTIGLNGLRNMNNNQNHNSNNNNIQHQASLKFSIDNILKADFGRRITDPIMLKKSRPKKPISRPIEVSKDFLETSSESSEASSTTTTSPTFSSTNSSTTTQSGTTSESGKQMLWPAWVYCTRYSDRPSSGKKNLKFIVQMQNRVWFWITQSSCACEMGLINESTCKA